MPFLDFNFSALFNFSGFVHAVTSLLALILLAAKVWALLDCAIRTDRQLYPVAGRLSKGVWLIILGASTFFAVTQGPFSLFNLAGTVAMIVYFVDTAPKVRQARRYR